MAKLQLVQEPTADALLEANPFAPLVGMLLGFRGRTVATVRKQALRALVGARVSVVQGPQKVSHEAQLETATKWAKSKGYKIVGSFEDLGVSASVLTTAPTSASGSPRRVHRSGT